MSRFLTLLIATILLAAAATAMADDMTVKVVSLTGDVNKRNAADAKSKWEPVKVGDELGEQWLIRTGLGSRVVIQMGDRNKVTVREATKMGISEFKNVGGAKVKTQLGLKYGSVRTAVDSTRGPSEFKLATPVATMAISGTDTTSGFNGDTGYGHQNNSGSSSSTNTGTGTARNTSGGEGTNGDGTRDGEQRKQDVGTGSTGDTGGGQSGGEQQNNNHNGGGPGGFGNAAGGGFAPGFEGGIFSTGLTNPLAPIVPHVIICPE